jgi:SRSO17 transposase
MTIRQTTRAAPGLLEDFAQAFDSLFSMLNQREAFRRYVEGLLLPTERNKTLTGLANTEPVVGAQEARAQSLQWYLSESTWDAVAVNQRRVELLKASPSLAPDGEGALVIDETGDRKDGHKTAHVGRQYLGNLGKIDNGVVSVTSLWADEQVYYPLDVEPYTPATWFEGGTANPAFRTKLKIALELVEQALQAAIPFRAVVADNFYGEDRAFREGLEQSGVGYVLALKPSHTWRHGSGDIGSLEEAARAATWVGPQQAGAWIAVERSFRDGHTEPWWALDVVAGPFGPQRAVRGVVVTTDPLTLPELTTWYLITNLPTPGSPRAAASPLAAASLAELVRLYGLRTWVEQSYKQVKYSLGWAQYQVRSDTAIRRHWTLVCCAFTFCWWQASHDPAADHPLLSDPATQPTAPQPQKKHRTQRSPQLILAARSAPGQGLARTLPHAQALLASLLAAAPAPPPPAPA